MLSTQFLSENPGVVWILTQKLSLVYLEIFISLVFVLLPRHRCRDVGDFFARFLELTLGNSVTMKSAFNLYSHSHLSQLALFL